MLILFEVFILCGTKWAVTPAPSPGPSAGQSTATRDGVELGFSFQMFQSSGLAGLLVRRCTHLTCGALTVIGFGTERLIAGRDAGQLDSIMARRILCRYAGENDLWHERVLLDRFGERGAKWVIVNSEHDVYIEDFENKVRVVPPGAGRPSGLEEQIYPCKAPPSTELCDQWKLEAEFAIQLAVPDAK